VGEPDRGSGLPLEDGHIGRGRVRAHRGVPHVTRRRTRSGAALALVVMATMALAHEPASLDGTWRGTVDMGARHSPGTASGALFQAGEAVTGSLTIDATPASGVFTVKGTLHGRRVVLAGRLGARRLRWKGRWGRKAQAWRGPMVERVGGVKMRAVLALTRDQGGGPTCGSDYFASDVMPKVIDPICSQCHVPGGLAQTAPFKVTPGNPKATARSAITEVDPGDPTHSKLVDKPLGQLPHGGGTRFLPGSIEEQTLRHWIALVTAPGCDLGSGGGGGRGGTGADLYAENCASCHGADARGLDGRPDIHCARDIADPVRNGRRASPGAPPGDMPAFTNLTDAEIAEIQAFLAGLCPPSAVTGAALFAGNCAACHGADATGSTTAPSVRCATRVADAVTRGRAQRMPIFPALTGSEIALLQAWLDGLCTMNGRMADDLWVANCSTCHGATATGGENGLGVQGPDIRCNRNIHDAVVAPSGVMPPFAMADADIARVQGFLVGLCPVGSATGDDLFAANCATCHGPAAIGTAAAPNVRCATRVADAMQTGRGALMPSFPGIVSSEITTIQGYLTALCTQLGRPGPDLYVGNCATCHGTTASGGRNGLGVRGPDIRCTGAGDFSEAIRFGSDAMPRFPALDTSDVTAIIDYVHGTFCTGR
jgi:mono/diheme cytochrome c family protein